MDRERKNREEGGERMQSMDEIYQTYARTVYKYLLSKTRSEDIAEELTEMQKNSLLYTMATRRMSNIITEMKTVINVGK